MSRAFEKLTKIVEEKNFQIATLMNKLELQTNEESNRGEVNEASKKGGANRRHDGSTSDGFENEEARSNSLASLSVQQLQDMITSTIRAQYGGPSRNNIMYSKPYTKQIDNMRKPAHYPSSSNSMGRATLSNMSLILLKLATTQGNRPANFEELTTRAHDMEISIANHVGNNSDVPSILDFLLEKEVIELPGSKRLEESGRVNESRRSDGAGARVVFVSPQRQVLPYAFTFGEKCSNNVAEYQALVIGLQMALELRIPSLSVSGDSKLVINQLLKEYEVKKEDLVPYFRYATILINKFDSVELEHVPREENRMADALANLATTLALRGLFLHCLEEKEAAQAMDEAHSGVCGAHQSGPKLHFRIKRMDYYWPTMVKDCLDYAKRCKACQFHVNFIHQPPESLHPTVAS
ncbi:hypothetical protein RJ639_000602 [Escallonia herrerae]|uniref:RNase H type-1 domain-containing protein n=1 Tax=Escallonia herrerae TaxID=1293975 RepID=A0AA89BK24_9ASTE|nr:hypothetical protein RJ639_000602 [Escallonia herrerae]